MFSAFVSGFFISLSLILAIGPQNSFVIRQGLLNQHVLAVVLFCGIADALLICTEWHAFRNPDFEGLKAALKSHVIFDGRNIYSPQEMKALGFAYYSIGR